MARKAPEAIDTTRRLAFIDHETGATGVSHNGIIYVRGMEDQMPDDFPQDGPWWEDWMPDDVVDPRADTPEALFSRAELDKIDAERVASSERQRLARQGVQNPHADNFDGEDNNRMTGPPVTVNRARGKTAR